jgi:hypothetical protein
MSTTQTKKADIGLAGLAQAQAADGGGSNTVLAVSPAVATGSIPTTGNGVCVAHVAVTPKFSGKFRVTVTGATNPNANVGAQGVFPTIGTSPTAPTDGTTPIAPLVVLPETTAAAGASAVVAGQGLLALGPATVGVPQFIAVAFTQSAVSAFAVQSAAVQISVTEVP